MSGLDRNQGPHTDAMVQQPDVQPHIYPHLMSILCIFCRYMSCIFRPHSLNVTAGFEPLQHWEDKIIRWSNQWISQSYNMCKCTDMFLLNTSTLPNRWSWTNDVAFGWVFGCIRILIQSCSLCRLPRFTAHWRWLLEHCFHVKVTKQTKFHQGNWVRGETTHGKLEFLCVSDRNCIYEGILQIDSWGPLA